MLKNKGILSNYIDENKLKILVLTLLLLLGCIMGIIIANSIDNNIRLQLLEYMDASNKMVLDEGYAINNYEVIKATIINNVSYIGIILILGCSIIFSPLIYLVIIHKGFSIGFCISFLIMLLGNVKGSIYAIISILLPNLVLVIAILYLSILWINFGRNILKNRDLYGLKRKIYKSIVITAVILVILLALLIPIELFTNNMLCKYIKII